MMKRRALYISRIHGIRVFLGLVLIAGICYAISTATLQPGNSCPDNLKEEQHSDELEYTSMDEVNASFMLDEMNTKYCEWAAAGDCFRYDLNECSRYGVFLPGVFLTSDASYILKDGQPGISVLFGAWKKAGNTTESVPNTDITLRIYQKDPFNVRLHKTIQTGDDGTVPYEWFWRNAGNNKNKDLILEYSHDDIIGEIPFYTKTTEGGNFTDGAAILDTSRMPQ
ncbi:hypothetical protein [uncultured Methanospirillum sp.]|uniref:hypothetical protein n=1 Tax=uncultured Methanospirillum sp. TaxID=262503 RepID=UPI0029C78DEA|nr:hypothetical protein [uncultured Methanospirillum sp.]